MNYLYTDKKATTVTVGILITDLKMDINKMVSEFLSFRTIVRRENERQQIDCISIMVSTWSYMPLRDRVGP